MHIDVAPSILYFGTPVVLMSSLNADGSANVAPMSSVWWLGWNCMLGLGVKGHTAANIQREKECVLNLPSAALAEKVNKLARLTGSDPVPPYKQAMGYRHEKDKFGVAGFSVVPSELVKPPSIRECPVQLEAVLEAVHPFGTRPDKPATALAFEMRVVRARIDDALLMPNKPGHVDPDRWRPLIMSFCRFYGAGRGTLPVYPS